jgi:hypothetical protein
MKVSFIERIQNLGDFKTSSDCKVLYRDAAYVDGDQIIRVYLNDK